MATLVYLLYTIAISTITGNPDELDECPRIHKAWHLTTQHEKDLYIAAIHKLNDQGKLARFSTTHHFLIDSEQSHYTAAFFPWHRYFIWEVQSIESFHNLSLSFCVISIININSLRIKFVHWVKNINVLPVHIGILLMMLDN